MNRALLPSMMMVLSFAACSCETILPSPSAGDAGDPGEDAGPVGCIDLDGDHYGPGCGLDDCDDTNPAINPSATELCGDGIDNNCDGKIDDGDCSCPYGLTEECYAGDPATKGVGLCKAGQYRCTPEGTWGPCIGAVLPVLERCDGLDNDCDGEVDEGLLNACGACGEVPAEACDDGVDNDCNGTIDDGCSTCDPGCLCSGGACECKPPVNQPCYGGRPGTAGLGECKAGLHDCRAETGGGWAWSVCRGQSLPTAEVCDDGLDNDCDGDVDEGCGSTCVAEPELCDGLDNDCDGLIDEGATNACGGCGPVEDEICDNLDNNCNGRVDEGCRCTGAKTQTCYRGPAATLGVGACVAGTQRCTQGEIGSWGLCEGDVTPQPEACGNGIDDDCDGEVDDGCTCTEGATRRCGLAVGTCKQGVETCTGGEWSACEGVVAPVAETCDHLDNDCDGLVDEGVMTACGKCPPESCYTEDYPNPGVCGVPGRTCDGVGTDPGDPGAITLNKTTNTLRPFIYIAVTNKNEVALLDTSTGQKIWQKSSHGKFPSRTAVALDGTVWVGNRCLVAGSENDFSCSSLTHLDLDGNLICRADVPGWVRGVAIDADGNIWAGTYNGRSLWKVSGSVVDATQTPPRCQILGDVNVGIPVYGIAIDGRGFVWTASSPTKKVDVATMQLVASVDHGGHYGVAIDQENRVWFGGYTGGGDMHRIDGDPPYTRLGTGINGITGVTVHPDGTVWGSNYSGSPRGVVKLTLNAAGTAITKTETFADPDNFSNHGIAVDKDGKLWSPRRSNIGKVNRWLPTGAHDGSFDIDVGQDLYSYSDMTGIQLRTITTREGHWMQDFDSGYATPMWSQVNWNANTPAGTSVQVSVRSADTAAGLGTGTGASAWCGPFNTSPASLAGCVGLNGHRWLRLDVKLNTTQDDVRPSVSGIEASWAH